MVWSDKSQLYPFYDVVLQRLRPFVGAVEAGRRYPTRLDPLTATLFFALQTDGVRWGAIAPQLHPTLLPLF